MTEICIKRITMRRCECNAITDLLYYGKMDAIETLYPFHPPSYDEDAGVYTDYGMNKNEVMVANLALMSLLQNPILDIEFDENKYGNNDPVTVYFLEMSVDAIGQAIWAIVCNKELQRKIWRRRAEYYYESDGHYENRKKEDIIQDIIEANWLDPFKEDKHGISGQKLVSILDQGRGPNVKTYNVRIDLKETSDHKSR